MILNGSIKLDGVDPKRLYVGTPAGPYLMMDTAILRLAIMDVIQPIRRADDEDVMIEAAVWFWDADPPDYGYSLNAVCERLGIDPDYVREVIWFGSCSEQRRAHIRASLPLRMEYPQTRPTDATTRPPRPKEGLDAYIARKLRERRLAIA